MKRDLKVFLIMMAASLFLFFALPILVNLVPNEQFSIYGTQVVYLIINVLFMGVIGWQAANFEKYSFLVPLSILFVFAISQILVLGAFLPVLILIYAETSYMVFCIRRILTRMKDKAEKKNKSMPFPKSVKRR